MLPISCFVGIFDLMTIEPCSMKSKGSKSRDGHHQGELQVTLMLVLSDQEKNLAS